MKIALQEGLLPGESLAEKLDFVGRQIVDAFSPGNFALTNPVVLREMRETRGESLMRGLQQLAEDLKDSEHGLRPRQTDMDAFEVGGNVATADGARALLDAGADPNAPDVQGQTSLHWAAGNGKRAEVVQALLDAGANPDSRDRNEKLPIDLIPEDSLLRGTNVYRELRESPDR